jgi:hypothetical protein
MALVERLSDGTYAVTRSTEAAFGLEAYAGVGAGVKVAGIDAGISAGVAVSEILSREGGQTWIVGSAEVEDLVHRLPNELSLPPPDVVYDTTDLRSTVAATVGTGATVSLDLVGAQLSFGRSTGQRLDRRTGRRTLFAGSTRRHEVAGGGVLGGSKGEVYAVEFDASGRPLDLQVATTGPFGGSRDLPDALQPVAGRLDDEVDGDLIYEVTAHLDLTQAGNLAAAAELLAALRRRGLHAGRATKAARALKRRIDERGTVEARILRTRTSSHELGLNGSLGARFGAEIASASGSSRLVAALSRGLDGQWLVREDCVAAA